MKPVRFQCLRSGNHVSFVNPNDIDGLRNHEGYKEVKEDVETAETVKTESPEAPVKEVLKPRMGRPPKQKLPSFLQE